MEALPFFNDELDMDVGSMLDNLPSSNILRRMEEAFEDLVEALKYAPQNTEIRRALDQLTDEAVSLGKAYNLLFLQ